MKRNLRSILVLLLFQVLSFPAIQQSFAASPDDTVVEIEIPAKQNADGSITPPVTRLVPRKTVKEGGIVRMIPSDPRPSQEGLGEANVNEIIESKFKRSVYKDLGESHIPEGAWLKLPSGGLFLDDLIESKPDLIDKKAVLAHDLRGRLQKIFSYGMKKPVEREDAFMALKEELELTAKSPAEKKALRPLLSKVDQMHDLVRVGSRVKDSDLPKVVDLLLPAYGRRPQASDLYRQSALVKFSSWKSRDKERWFNVLGPAEDYYKKAVDEWISQSAENKKLYADKLYKKYDAEYQLKKSPGVIDPEGEISLSDGHHGLRTAYNLMKEIQKFDPTRTDKDFFVDLKVDYNFSIPGRVSNYGHHLIELCHARKMYFAPETRKGIIDALSNPRGAFGITPAEMREHSDAMSSAAALNLAIDDSESELVTLESRYKDYTRLGRTADAAAVEAKMNLKKAEVGEFISNHRAQLEAVDRLIGPKVSGAIQKGVTKKFAESIDTIKHNAMRSFIGAALPNLPSRVDPRNHRVRIKNDHMVDYAEFYVEEWLRDHGFNPPFTEQDIQLSAPRKGDPQYLQKQKNYIKTLASMAQMRELVYGPGQASEEFGDLMKRLYDERKAKGVSDPEERRELEPYVQFIKQRSKYRGIAADAESNPMKRSGMQRAKEAFDRERREALDKMPPDLLATLRQITLAPRPAVEADAGGGSPAPMNLAEMADGCSGGSSPVVIDPESITSITRVAQSAVNAGIFDLPLFSPGSCLNPLKLTKDELVQQSLARTQMAAEAGEISTTTSRIAPIVESNLNDEEKNRQLISWFEKGFVSPP